MHVTQITPDPIFDSVCASGLIAKGNKEIAITKKSKGLRKLEGFLRAIFKSLVKVFV